MKLLMKLKNNLHKCDQPVRHQITICSLTPHSLRASTRCPGYGAYWWQLWLDTLRLWGVGNTRRYTTYISRALKLLIRNSILIRRTD